MRLPVALARASMLKPFMTFLRDLGAPVERELLRAGLPRWEFETHDVFVPTRGLTAFVARSARSEGIDDFGLRMAHRVGIGGLEQGLRRAISSAPTLLAGLQQL